MGESSITRQLAKRDREPTYDRPMSEKGRIAFAVVAVVCFISGALVKRVGEYFSQTVDGPLGLVVGLLGCVLWMVPVAMWFKVKKQPQR